jgi:hypothetical protein
LANTEGTAQRTDLDLEIALLDEDLWPDPGDQLFLRNHPAGIFNENKENVQRAAAEPDLLPAIQQQPLAGKQLE